MLNPPGLDLFHTEFFSMGQILPSPSWNWTWNNFLPVSRIIQIDIHVNNSETRPADFTELLLINAGCNRKK